MIERSKGCEDVNRVVHFELISRDPERTAAFYADVFGWTKTAGADGYWRLVTEEDAGTRGAGQSAGRRGINGATVRPLSGAVPEQTINTIHVANVDEFAAKTLAHGGRMLSDVLQLPGVGRFAYCADPLGIPFGLIEYAAGPEPEGEETS